MKTFKQLRDQVREVLKESVIDIPRRTYAPGVFDDADTNNPKIKSSVKTMIDKQVKEFEKEYPVIEIGLIGSILTKRYRNDADLDINVLFDVPKEKQEEYDHITQPMAPDLPLCSHLDLHHYCKCDTAKFLF